ncbi:hypothetical protein HDU76_005978 [Blyttiomyces sp. JEL0837]|nr:hypothetical protein HDU76_005978 [Blyttiomyces sp. JEL0837]
MELVMISRLGSGVVRKVVGNLEANTSRVSEPVVRSENDFLKNIRGIHIFHHLPSSPTSYPYFGKWQLQHEGLSNFNDEKTLTPPKIVAQDHGGTGRDSSALHTHRTLSETAVVKRLLDTKIDHVSDRVGVDADSVVASSVVEDPGRNLLQSSASFLVTHDQKHPSLQAHKPPRLSLQRSSKGRQTGPQFRIRLVIVGLPEQTFPQSVKRPSHRLVNLQHSPKKMPKVSHQRRALRNASATTATHTSTTLKSHSTIKQQHLAHATNAAPLPMTRAMATKGKQQQTTTTINDDEIIDDTTGSNTKKDKKEGRRDQWLQKLNRISCKSICQTLSRTMNAAKLMFVRKRQQQKKLTSSRTLQVSESEYPTTSRARFVTDCHGKVTVIAQEIKKSTSNIVGFTSPFDFVTETTVTTTTASSVTTAATHKETITKLAGSAKLTTSQEGLNTAWSSGPAGQRKWSLNRKEGSGDSSARSPDSGLIASSIGAGDSTAASSARPNPTSSKIPFTSNGFTSRSGGVVTPLAPAAQMNQTGVFTTEALNIITMSMFAGVAGTKNAGPFVQELTSWINFATSHPLPNTLNDKIIKFLTRAPDMKTWLRFGPQLAKMSEEANLPLVDSTTGKKVPTIPALIKSAWVQGKVGVGQNSENTKDQVVNGRRDPLVEEKMVVDNQGLV